MLASLEQAIEAIKAGNKTTGRAMLADILQADLENETAWLWMSGVVGTEAEKRRCLERVLDINPDSRAAKRGLALLEKQSKQPKPETPVPAQKDPEATEKADSSRGLSARLAAATQPQKEAIEPEVGISETDQKEMESTPESEAPQPEIIGVSQPDDLPLMPIPKREPESTPVPGDEALPAELPEEASDTTDVEVEITEESESAGEQEETDEEFAEETSDDNDLEEESSAAAEPPEGLPFWKTEQGILYLVGGGAAALLTCAACVIATLVFRPVADILPATVDAALGTPTSTITATPTPTSLPTNTATFTPTPTITPSPTSTPVVADTATPTATSTRRPTPNPNLLQGVVVEVIAGDLIDVSIDGKVRRVKYLSIEVPALNDPERGSEPFGQEALDINKLLVEGQQVTLEKDVTNTDDQGRLLRYVYAGALFVNEEMVRQGVAEVILVPPDTKYGASLQDVEKGAQATKLGIWSVN